MRIVTKEEMKALEIETVKNYGIDELIMMEHASMSIYLSMEEELGSLENKDIFVVVGKGNNGGDALAACRNFIESGARVRVCLALGDPTGDLPKKHLAILEKMKIPIFAYTKSTHSTFIEALKEADIVIDGILGTGTSNLLSNDLVALTDSINENSKYTVSVDIPSGVDANTGRVLGGSVKADMTVTFGLVKRGMLFYPGREMCGKVKLAKIGIVPRLFETEIFKGELTTFGDAKKLMPKRPRFSNKGTFGKVLIIAGSSQYTGAPVMTTAGALRVGAGLAIVGMPEPFNTVVTTTLPEAVAFPLPATQDGFIAVRSRNAIEELISRVDVIAIGPGLGKGFETGEVVKWLVSNFAKPLVVDADALNLLAKDIENVKFSKNTIITPHPGEFARLTSKDVNSITSDPVTHALEFAQTKGVCVLLKGATTVIASPDGKYTVNVTGNSGLATGGTGDVLTGMIAGFTAQGMNVTEAAKLAAYVHGRSAEVYAETKNEASLLPRDLIDCIPDVLMELSR